MPVAGAVRILLCAAEVAETDDVRQLLEQAGHQVIPHALASPDPENLADYQLVILEGSGDDGAALRLGQRLRGRLAESFVPVLLIANDHTPSADRQPRQRRRCLSAAAVQSRRIARSGPGLPRIKELHDRVAEKTAEVYRINKRLQQAYHQIDQELELARRLQLSFLPQTFPDVPECRFAVHYWLRGQVGGDCYDVFRLDESHLGLYVADVVGHGVAASLLTIFVKKGLRAKDVFGQQYRLVPPGEVLERLNRELMGQALPESPFITMVYVLLNHRTGELRFARARPSPSALLAVRWRTAIVAGGGQSAWRVRDAFPRRDAAAAAGRQTAAVQ